MTRDFWEREIACIDWEALIRDDELSGAAFKSSGVSIFTCTAYVWELMQLYPGRVEGFGFMGADNPRARSGQEVGGHDFAVIDGRFLIDIWIVVVASSDDLGTRMVFDLADEDDWPEIIRLYGDRFLWSHVPALTITEMRAEVDHQRHIRYNSGSDAIN